MRLINAMNKEPGSDWTMRGEVRTECWNCCLLLWRNLRGMPLDLMSADECFRMKRCTVRHFILFF